MRKFIFLLYICSQDFIKELMSGNNSTQHLDTSKLTLIGLLVSMGIVFGDIGTSPLYVMKAIINARLETAAMPLDE